MHMTTFLSRKLNILCMTLDNNADYLDICEGWHFTGMWKARA